MTLHILTAASVAMISTWAMWAIFSKRVRDGVVGKLIYSVIAISGYALTVRGELPWIASTAGATFLASLACAGVRHIVVVMWWAQVQAWLCRHLKCEHCLHDPRFGVGPGKTDRRRP